MSLASLHLLLKKNFELYGWVLPPNSGLQAHPSIVTSVMLDDVRDLLHSRPDYYIDEIQQWFLIAHGIGVSATTVYRGILDAGYTYKHLRLRARLRNETDVVFWVYLQGGGFFSSYPPVLQNREYLNDVPNRIVLILRWVGCDVRHPDLRRTSTGSLGSHIL